MDFGWSREAGGGVPDVTPATLKLTFASGPSPQARPHPKNRFSHWRTNSVGTPKLRVRGVFSDTPRCRGTQKAPRPPLTPPRPVPPGSGCGPRSTGLRGVFRRQRADVFKSGGSAPATTTPAVPLPSAKIKIIAGR